MIKELKKHIDNCPIGYFDNNLCVPRDTKKKDIITWIKKLHKLADNIKEN